ncbi:MAG TPA: choice-of-anchor tandem repeat GloVer-containing protein [Candidatus Rubrimentiphilum sp.]|nr:choice-of-anchor tandem repeat GloVer-containing protein [Candidatus Rubrimentiphilum sp.]
MKLRSAFTLFAIASALSACHGATAGLPRAGSTPGSRATPPRFVQIGGHTNYTVYMFHNYSASNGLATSPPNDGALPKGSLTLVQSGSATALYGRTAAGGNNIGHDGIGCGTVFSTNTDFTSYNVVYAFNGSDGCDPRHDAMVPINGSLYFTTQGVNDTSKDTYNNGDAYALVPGGTPSIVLAYNGAPNQGAQQHSSFTLDQTFGNVIFGQTAKGGANDKGQVYAITPSGSAYYPIHDFSKSDGTEPHGRIIQLGPTLWGITRSDGAGGGGTVFSLALTYANGIPQPQPTLNVVHAFVSGGSDAYFSDHGYLTPVTEGGQTVLYGMTQCGGGGTGGDSHHCGSGMGDGAIFRVVPHMTNGQYDGTGTYSVYYAFQGQDTAFPNGEHDGADPYGSLYYDASSGYMYGMTAYGGSSDDDGTVFRFIPGSLSTYEVIHHFTGKNGDGAKPIDNVIVSGGLIYGMTVYGGTSDDSLDGTKGGGNGTIFAIPVP